VGRLSIFAKGNLDVRDSLHSLKLGGRVAWNGVNEIIRQRFPGAVVRLRHETGSRSDALLAADGQVPEDLIRRRPPLGPHTLEAQFGQALFEARDDIIVLSIQPDLMVPLVRHRTDGYRFYPNDWQTWPEDDRAWLRREFDPIEALDAETSMGNFAGIIERIRSRSTAPILVYNISAVVPGEAVHAHQGLGDILSTRIRRFNLALIELSEATGVSIIDVDTVLARAGAERLKLDAVHLTPDGCRLVAEEVVRVIEDLGLLPPPDRAP
jgi:hypothetical protein